MASKPLLIDIGSLSCGCTDHTLETIAKAQRLDDDSLFAPHHDPYIRDHLEAVTARGRVIMDSILAGLLLFIQGGQLLKADALGRWTPEQLAHTRALLEAKGPEQLELDDWLTLVDWLIQRYLPPDVALTEAEYLTARANFAGRIQAAIEGQSVSDKAKAALVAAAPSTIADAMVFGKPSNLEAVVLRFARARAAELITDIGERVRHRLKSLILAHEESVAIGGSESSVAKLQQQMQDEFAVLNRDFRRIAITETARNANEGYIAALPPGARVRRMEAYATACPFCKSIHGKVFTVVDPATEGKDGWSQVWVGKTNVGRSSSPRKRVGDELVERTDTELWWPAAGTQHPNCRGTWVRVSDKPPGVDPKFAAWLEKELSNV